MELKFKCNFVEPAKYIDHQEVFIVQIVKLALKFMITTVHGLELVWVNAITDSS